MPVERWLRAVAVSVLTSGLLIASSDAFAEEEARFPNLHGEISFELQNDWTYRSGDEDDEINDLYVTIEPSFSLGLNERVSLEASLVLEPVFDPQPAESRYFDDQGLFVEQLFLQYATGRWGVRAGKINPHFGIAWDAAPGIYGVDFAEDYEITERIGVGGFLRLGNDRVGFHRLAADVFFLDTSFLSRSALNDRGRLERSDGGPSNTGDPRSFALALEGEGIPRLPGLGYQLGLSRQEAGRDGRDEYGYAAGLVYRFSPRENLDVELLSEYVYQRGAEGERRSRHYSTQGSAIRWKRWNLGLSSTLRDLDGGGGARDYLFQASVGYEFEMGLAIDFGWRYSREDGVETNGLGALVRYTVEF
jgi:hypothetical protein